jgi:putative toxin-antitoxin system antitoxin component (TIGR02293 family)
MDMTEFTPDLSEASLSGSLMFTKIAQWLSVPINHGVDLAKVAKNGLSLDCYDKLLKHGYSRRDLNWVIQPRTLSHRRQRNECLNVDESSRLLRVIRIQILAEAVLGDAQKAQRWMIKPRSLFSGMSAKELVQLEQGAPLVEEALIQLDEGYFA